MDGFHIFLVAEQHAGILTGEGQELHDPVCVIKNQVAAVNVLYCTQNCQRVFLRASPSTLCGDINRAHIPVSSLKSISYRHISHVCVKGNLILFHGIGKIIERRFCIDRGDGLAAFFLVVRNRADAIGIADNTHGLFVIDIGAFAVLKRQLKFQLIHAVDLTGHDDVIGVIQHSFYIPV